MLGDTALFSDLALAKRAGKIDLAIVPIGGHYTMDRHDAVAAVDLVDPFQVIPSHYGTFPPIEYDPARFAARLGEQTNTRRIRLGPTRHWSCAAAVFPTLTGGVVPYKALPLTAPPTMRWWLPQPWSEPSPLEASVRPKSDAVKAVTLLATPSSAVAV
mgnify:CR=1 FL=1